MRLEDNEYTDENGITYRKHYASVGNGIMSYAFSEVWYPVADDDPVRFFFIVLFGGVFGLHKFKTKEYLQGIFYLLTCGGFGIFYISDIISIVTGNYYVRQINYEDSFDSIIKTKTRAHYPELQRNPERKGSCAT